MILSSAIFFPAAVFHQLQPWPEVFQGKPTCGSFISKISPHYATTLRLWRERFFAHLERVRAIGFSESLIRMWEFYLTSCEGSFQERYYCDVQMVLARPHCRRAPILPALSTVMTALWFTFAMLVSISISWIKGKYLLAEILGGLAGPVACWGEKSWAPFQSQMILGGGVYSVNAVLGTDSAVPHLYPQQTDSL